MAYDLDKFLEVKKKLEETLDRNEIATMLAQKLTEGCGRDLDKFLETKKKIVESLDQSEIVIMMAQKLAEDDNKGNTTTISYPYIPTPTTPTTSPWTSPITWEMANFNYGNDGKQGTTADLR